jgi:NTE family protein
MRISLVLGSGGARGYAHIGVIEELEKAGLEIVSVCGSSMGALVGGLYAAGALEEYKKWVLDLDPLDVASLLDISFEGGGLIKGEKVFERLEKMTGRRRIEELEVRYTAVATDIAHSKEVWFQEGDLLTAIRASIAIPSVFTPVEYKGMVLVDGGVLNPLPVAPVMSDHTDIIIAVNVYGDVPKPQIEERERGRMERIREALRSKVGEYLQREYSMLEIAKRSFDVMQNTLVRYRLAGYPPDHLIEISKDVCDTFDFHKAPEVIEAGRIAAKEALERILGGESA